MNESELYKELGVLTKDKRKWEENIPYVSSLLDHESVKIQAKALWLLGEMGLVYPSVSTKRSSRNCFLFRQSGSAAAGAGGECSRHDRTGQLSNYRTVLRESVPICQR